MKNSKVLKGILILMGVLLMGLGAWRLFDPISFFENSGIVLNNDAGLLNEARATGGVVVGFGLLVLLGAFRHKLAYTSTIASIVLFFGFGIARLIGFVLDGNVSEMLIQGMVVEFVFGLVGVFVLFKYRE